MVARRGRPRGRKLNRKAVEFALTKAGMNKVMLAEAVKMSTGHLADCLHRGKGVSDPLAFRLAQALGCDPEVICPELDGFVAKEAVGD